MRNSSGIKILVTNDDGISAEGIYALAEKAMTLGTVTVVAPEEQRSANSHFLTLYNEVEVKEEASFLNGVKAWSVRGTPVDCVKIGVTALLEEKPDIILSGINMGPNIATDVLYSGTVAAAMEGLLLGIPSIAVSINGKDSFDFEAAQEITCRAAEYMLSMEKECGFMLNINVPAVNKEEIRGVKLTKCIGIRKYAKNYSFRQENNKSYYKFIGEFEKIPNTSEDLELDEAAVNHNYISITPLTYDWVAKDSFLKLKKDENIFKEWTL
jgi:5'-nucleotidase